MRSSSGAGPFHLARISLTAAASRSRHDDASGTRLALVCADRPGLLAGVAQVFRARGIRVHDARIATFGERVEDFFLITDESNHALAPPQRQALGEALARCVDETIAGPLEGRYVIA